MSHDRSIPPLAELGAVRAPAPRLASANVASRAGQRTLRDHNLILVYSRIAQGAPCSRAELAEATGLTKATVSSLVATLITRRLVAELAPAPTRSAGRPATPLAVAAGTVAALGAEINVDFLGVRAIDLTGATVAEDYQRWSPATADPARAFTALAGLACPIITRLSQRGVRLVGAGLALPGIADHPAGPLRLAPNLGWHDVDVHQQMADALAAMGRAGRQVPGLARALLVDSLVVDNEANLAARAEIGRHRDQSFIYVSGEVGIGAAIVVDGQVFSGVHGWAGEIGHVVVDPQGPRCACGASGCLEVYAGQRWILTAAGLDSDDEITTVLAAHRRGEPRARAAIDSAGQALGIALANCLNIVDVPRVVLGGSFAPLAPVLAPGLSAQIASRVLWAGWAHDLDIAACTAGPYPATTGAALAVLDQAVADPSSALWAPPGLSQP